MGRIPGLPAVAPFELPEWRPAFDDIMVVGGKNMGLLLEVKAMRGREAAIVVLLCRFSQYAE